MQDVPHFHRAAEIGVDNLGVRELNVDTVYSLLLLRLHFAREYSRYVVA